MTVIGGALVVIMEQLRLPLSSVEKTACERPSSCDTGHKGFA